MMKVIGEDGTSMADFIVYLKSEFLDYVYLQQNTFDEVDAACGEERQKYMFAKVLAVLEETGFSFPGKDEARRYFLELRQLFMDMNYLPFDGDAFKEQERRIAQKIAEGKNTNA